MIAWDMVEEQENVLKQRAAEQLESFLSECKIEDFRGKRILEIGFKNGLFLDECHRVGLIPTGLEICRDYHEAVSARFPHLDLLLYDGGTFPVPDASFDFVVSFQVLEHVASIEHIFSESIRVLKPGGIMYHVAPNFFSFYDGHYKIVWLPFLNKRLGRLYLKALGRYTPYFEGLNLVKPRSVVRALSIHKDRIEILSLGRDEFIGKFNRHQIDKVNQKFLRMVLKGILAIPPLKVCLLYLMALANLYYPITIIARRLSRDH